MDSFRSLLARAHKLPDQVHMSPRLTPRDPLWFSRILGNLFSPISYSLRRFIWQADLGVVNFVFEAFQLRRQVKQSRGFGSG
jgi:hypothetical protein